MVAKRTRRRVFDILERDVPGDHVADAVHFALIAVVVISVVIAVLSTVPSLSLSHAWWFAICENVALLVFVVEYIGRVWVAPEDPLRRGMRPWKARFSYALTPFAIIDLLAILPLVAAQFSDYELQALLVLRLLRFLKLARYSSGFNALFLALKRERYALFSCFLILIAGVLTAATAMYLVERTAQPDHFGSIPEAMWWAITTLTTVGYGDVVPLTTLGRIIGGLTMVAGLIMLALPIAIIASSFSEVIAQHNFVVTFSMLSRLAPFTDLDPKTLGALMPALHSRTFDKGRLLVRRGDKSGHIYVVLEGMVEVEHAKGSEHLGPGGVFGVGLDASHEDLVARAVTKTKLLIIEENELHTLMARYPMVVARLSGMVLANGEKAEADTPEAKAAEAGTSEAKKAEPRKAEAGAPEAKKPDAKKTEAGTPEAKKPDARKADTKAADTKTAEAKVAEAVTPEARKNESGKAAPKKPEAGSPEPGTAEAGKAAEAEQPQGARKPAAARRTPSEKKDAAG